MKIVAAVDGSSLGNPGPAGWAWVISADQWDAGGWRRATNNVGELTAVLELLQATERAGLAGRPLHILADSQYVINGLTKWMPNWKKRGWKKADGKPVANQDLFEQLDRALAGRTVTFEWVRGHTGHSLNEAADDHAREAAEAYQAGRPAPSGPGFSGSERDDEPFTEWQTPTFNEKAAKERWDELTSLAQRVPVRIITERGAPLVLFNSHLAETALFPGGAEPQPPAYLF